MLLAKMRWWRDGVIGSMGGKLDGRWGLLSCRRCWGSSLCERQPAIDDRWLIWFIWAVANHWDRTWPCSAIVVDLSKKQSFGGATHTAFAQLCLSCCSPPPPAFDTYFFKRPKTGYAPTIQNPLSKFGGKKIKKIYVKFFNRWSPRWSPGDPQF